LQAAHAPEPGRRPVSIAGKNVCRRGQVGIPNDVVLVVGYDRLKKPPRLAFGYAPRISRRVVQRKARVCRQK
jgi:hypothetical protein